MVLSHLRQLVTTNIMKNLPRPPTNLKRLPLDNQDSSQQMEIDVIDEETMMKLRNSLTIGAKLRNHKGEFLGRIKELTYDDNNQIQYMILHCTSFFGEGNRYFAVPVSSDLLKLSKEGKILLEVDKNDLKLAKGISADKCPPPSLSFGPSIYELYNYIDSTGQKSGNQNSINKKNN